MEHVDTVVCGGGVSGLAAAHGLARARVPFVLLEGSRRWGGRIRTERENGFLLEAGPDSLLAQKPAAADLCRALGIGGRLLPAREPRTVYVLHRGRLHALPPGMAAGVPSSVPAFLRSRLFSWPAKVRMALERAVPARTDSADESIAEFFRRRLGHEALDLLGDPLLAGIHAGNSERLSLRATMPRLAQMEASFGSLWRGLASSRRAPAPGPLFYTLLGGLQELVEAMVDVLPGTSLRAATPVRGLRHDAGGFVVDAEGGYRVHARSVILATPAPVSAQLLPLLDPGAAVTLADIPFVSTATVLLGYRREDVGHPLDGHGMLIPRGEGLRTTACSFVSTKFGGRAPRGHVLLRAFVGGARDNDALSLGTDGLIRTVRDELGPVLSLRGEPCVWRVFPWPAAMPQMEVGHGARMAELEARLSSLPGLFLAGAGLRGTGIPDAIGEGLATAASVARFLSGTRAA
jgi:protoporphyrinogen/coproporphyrinogen III oxidase